MEEKAYELYKNGETTVASKEEAIKVAHMAQKMDKEYSDGTAQYGYTLAFKNCYIVKQF